MRSSVLLTAATAAVLSTAAPTPTEHAQEISPRQVQCAPLPSPFPTWQQLPLQSSLPDPFLPLKYTTTDNAAGSSSFARDVMTGNAPNRIKSRAEWYECRQPEILQLLQEYQFGYYPDPAQEKVEATRSGTTLQITVTGPQNKRGSFRATIQLPSGASSSRPAPVVINIGGMQNQPNSKTGAFWSIYNGRDIGVLTAWAWGFHRTLDAIQLTVPEIDPYRVGVTGCSRLGKAALAAGLFDKRITVTMPMSSGVQGLGPYRYFTLSGQGENLENSKQGAGWWSNSKLGTFMNHHENLPFDAHTIAAAIAPRALIMDQGTGDQFVNSKGTATVIFPAAKVVYDWLGAGDKIGINVRSGGHCDMSGFNGILPFVQNIFFNTTTTRNFHSLGTYNTPLPRLIHGRAPFRRLKAPQAVR
ncbi:hypothetical protein B0T21DRAFT_412548 [Apiosordaria backusii]|uniref:(4-O-methyl)-D-glucuronate--lignin esterase n=1 Tax=Apiosordaria backusii TaxID=314023 RepID=A0AA40BEE3_9PEZI|nr:hypothetical protein B0T21DRAFT_412548 [Apiosordaria backusii]